MHPRLERLVTGSLFAGLEIQFLAGGMLLHLVVLKKKGKQLVIEKAVTSLDKIELLSAHLTKDIPLALAFTGKGILHRRIAGDPAGDPKLFLSKVLPNASLKDFYMQRIPAACDEQFVSVLRKPIVDSILEQLKDFSVVGCSLGSFAALNSLPLLDGVTNELKFGNHELHVQDRLPGEAHYAEDNPGEDHFNIGGQIIEAKMLLAFSAAFQQLMPVEQRVEMQVESLEFSKSDFLQKKLFVAGGKTLLATVLLLLLGNYLLFSRYWSEKSELDSKLQINGGALTELRNLEKQVEVKHAFLEQTGLLSGSHHSYYADQIAAGLPGEILLSRMNLAPRLKLTEEDSIGFKPGRVEIDGSCSQSVVLNKWLQELKMKKWVRSATLESYLQDKNMKQGEFKIALLLE
jgi:hypothetical protein